MRRPWIVIAAVAVIAVLAVGLTQLGSTSTSGGGRSPSLRAAQRALAGSPQPLAALHDDADAMLDIKDFPARIKALHGYPIVVNVWGAWCNPCREEFPVLARVAAKVGKRVAFVGVATQASKEDTSKFLRQHPVTYPSYMDFDGRQANSYGIIAAPATVFYDRSGKRAYLHQGKYLSDAALERDIRRYTGA